MFPALLAILLTVNQSVSPSLESARQLYQQRRIDDAIVEIQQWIKLHPSDPSGYSDLGIYLRQKGVHERTISPIRESIKMFEKALSLDQSIAGRAIILGNLGTSSLELNDFTNAHNYFLDAFKQSNRVFYKVRAAYAHARAGSISPALSLVRPLTPESIIGSDSQGNEGLTAFNISIVYAIAKDASSSVRWLRIANDQRPDIYLQWAREDDGFDPIRNSPTFKALVPSKHP